MYDVILPLIIVKAGLLFFGFRMIHPSLDSELGPLQMPELGRYHMFLNKILAGNITNSPFRFGIL